MDEAKKKVESHKVLLVRESRCVYCENSPSTVEHMPPLTLFKDRKRPNGLVFAACQECNNKTKGADITATVFSRISPTQDGKFWASPDGVRLLHTLDRDAPGVRHEVFDDRRANHQWVPNRAGILRPMVSVNASGPLLKAYMDIFAGKLGMALFKEHVGTPLPASGLVQTKWFLNHGLAEQTAHAMLSIMPLGGTLSQGSFSVPEQFAYRYNCDNRSILAALVGLNRNVHIFILASSTPDEFGMPHVELLNDEVSGNLCRPGELLMLLPTRIIIP
jgi:hypothetical protein